VAQVPASVQKIQTEVLEEFVVLHLVPEQSEGRDAAVWSWRRLDSRESQYFFSKFQTDALHDKTDWNAPQFLVDFGFG
jgi:hypothetical protein